MHRHLPRLLATLALGGCGSVDVTSVRIELDYDDAWALSDVEVAIGDRRGASAAAHTVRVIVPDEMAGESAVVDIQGRRGDDLVARGSGEVVPERGREIVLRAELERIACGDWCTVGATACELDGTVTCELDADGCPAWTERTACPSNTPQCSIGTCAETCVDECAPGDRWCDGPGGVRVCGEADTDPCADWLPAIACADDETCSNGACAPSCRDECEPGDVRCLGQGTVRCGDRDLDGCREWGPIEPCDQGATCSAGACSASCADDCPSDGCTGNAVAACGQFDFDPCQDASPGVSCMPADQCLDGACSDGACATAPITCDAPPAAECIDGSTLRAYDNPGSCGASGCDYASRDIECASCPDCDACASVVCDDPPSACFAATGSCDGGSCSYDYADGARCSDGNACTDDDQCATGVCAGTPVLCAEPPAPRCVSATTLRTYGAIGSCSAGDCSYPVADIDCPAGCGGDACLPGWAEVSAGTSHTCAIRESGELECWGWNVFGQASPPPGTYRQVSAGVEHTCALRTDGTVVCFGNNQFGQTNAPGGTFSAVTAGQLHSCAHKSDTIRVVCWGGNNQGQLNVPQVNASELAKGGNRHGCILRSDAVVQCWGDNFFGQATAPAGWITGLTAGLFHSCGIDQMSRLICWGDNGFGQRNFPNGTFTSVDAGDFHSCAIDDLQAIRCWGNDPPIEAPPAGSFRRVSAGGQHSCAIRINGALVCWGDDSSGQSSPP